MLSVLASGDRNHIVNLHHFGRGSVFISSHAQLPLVQITAKLGGRELQSCVDSTRWMFQVESLTYAQYAQALSPLPHA
jgi:hypothetical protein